MTWLDWYNDLAKPSWTPAPSTISLIWMILYVIILVSFGFVFVQTFRSKIPRLVALPFAINLVANLLFMPIFSGLRNVPLAAVDIVIVWATIIWSAVAVWSYYRWVGLVFSCGLKSRKSSGTARHMLTVLFVSLSYESVQVISRCAWGWAPSTETLHRMVLDLPRSNCLQLIHSATDVIAADFGWRRYPRNAHHKQKQNRTPAKPLASKSRVALFIFCPSSQEYSTGLVTSSFFGNGGKNDIRPPIGNSPIPSLFQASRTRADTMNNGYCPQPITSGHSVGVILFEAGPANRRRRRVLSPPQVVQGVD